MLKAVVFDMDGVIVDTEPLSFKTHSIILERYGEIYTSEFHRSTMGNSISEVYRKIKEQFNISEDEEEFAILRKNIFGELLNKELKIINGLFPLLKNIRDKRIKCAVATGNNRYITEKIFKQLDILDYFDFIICSEEIKHSKPDPWVYKFVTEKLDIAAEDCIVLEDSKNGILSAINAGCNVIAVNSTWEFNNEEQILSVEKDLTGVSKILFN
jgi:beta-phosphoglucomutase